jgi:hypothetical protein
VPTADEVSSELVVVNYAPRRLRALPTGTGDGGYLLLGSERPELTAVFRPLAVTTRKAPAAALSRAGELAWVGDHVVAAPALPGPAVPSQTAAFLVYDRDSKVATPAPVALPTPCTQTLPTLLQSDGRELFALVRCAPEDTAIMLRLSGAMQLLATRIIRSAAATELFVHRGDVDYLLAGRKVLRVDSTGQKVSPTLPAVGSGGTETRELVDAGALLLVLDGSAGRVTALDSQALTLRFARRLYRAYPVTRLRAALGSPERLLIAVAERPGPAAAAGPTQLVAMLLPLIGPDRFPTRILLGSGPPTSDHELVPIATSDGGGALLVRTHAGNSGPLVALFRLNL